MQGAGPGYGLTAADSGKRDERFGWKRWTIIALWGLYVLWTGWETVSNAVRLISGSRPSDPFTLLSVYGDRTVPLKEFLIRRFFRIAPLFYLGAAFYQLAQFLSQGTTASAVDIVSTVLFIHVWEPHNINNVVPGCWSIGNEAMFYILFPTLSRSLKSIGQTIIAVALSFGLAFAFKGLIPALLPHIDQNTARDFWKWGFPTILSAFMCGFLVFRLLNADTPWLRFQSRWFLLFALAAFLVTSACYQSAKIFRSFWFDDLLLVVGVLAVASHQPRLIVNRAIQSVGQVSYSIYLVHFGVLSYIVKPLVLPLVSSYSPYVQFILLLLAIFVPSYLIACVTFAQIERPMIRFGRHVSLSLITRG